MLIESKENISFLLQRTSAERKYRGVEKLEKTKLQEKSVEQTPETQSTACIQRVRLVLGTLHRARGREEYINVKRNMERVTGEYAVEEMHENRKRTRRIRIMEKGGGKSRRMQLSIKIR